MEKFILYCPSETRDNLLPMTYLRPVADLRLGILTISEKWQKLLPGSYSYQTVDYLSVKYPTDPVAADSPSAVYISGDVLPAGRLVAEILALPEGTALHDSEGREIARRGNDTNRIRQTEAGVRRVRRLYDIFLMNFEAIEADFDIVTAGKTGREPDSSVTVIGDKSRLFIDPDASDVRGCTINVTKGPVYIGPGAEVMEGACLRGPVAVCEESVVNMGAKIYGGTTIGPHSKVGGELNNVVIQAYSNKAHDGFLGNAVIGEWCNLGAGCTASNLKNDYTEIKLWNYPAHRFIRTGLQFCGLIMGDHSKAGINTMLNTATVLGVGVNIHGSGFPRPFLASFSEGSTAGFSDVPMAKFFEIARKAMARRGVELTDTDVKILNHVREIAEQYR